MSSDTRSLPQNKQWYIHVLVMAILTYGLFAGFFKKNTMMNASDQVNALGIKTPIQNSLTHDGELASWNRGILGGMPTGDALAGDYMYPPAMALSYVSPVWKVFGLKMILHVFIAGLFFYLMLWRGFAFPPAIAAIGAVLYMFNPQFVSHIAPGHDGKMFVIAWLPFMVWHLKRLMDKPNLLSTSLFALGLGMSLLTSHIQMTYFALWGLFAFWLTYSIRTFITTKDFKAILPMAAGFWGGVALGMALGAVQFLPAYQFIQEHLSVRGADRTIETAASWSLHWGEVFSLWVPEIGHWFGYYWGANPFKLNSEYAGMIAFLFSIFALVRKRGVWRIFWSVVAVFSVAISLGLHTPIFRIAYAVIPGVKKFRALSMFMFWYSFATVILSMLFMKDVYQEFWTELKKETLAKWQKGVLISIGVVTVLAVLFSIQGVTQGLMEALTPELRESAQKQLAFDFNFTNAFRPMLWLWWAFAAGSLATLYFVLTGKLKKEIFLWVVLVVGLVDVLRVNHKFISMDDLTFRKNQQGGIAPATWKRDLWKSDRTYRVVNPEIKKLQNKLKDEPFRVLFLPVLSRLESQNIAGALGLEGLGGFHDNELVTFRTFRGQGGQNFMSLLQGVQNIDQLKTRCEEGSNLLNVANCEQFVVPYEDKGFGGKTTTNYMVFENKNALPRLSFTNRFIVADDQTAMTYFKNPFHSAVDSVILSEQPEGVVQGDSLNTAIVTEWKKYTANHREAEVTVQTDGLLRIAEVWYPGWEILVDGIKVEPVRSDITWMAVPLKAGNHTITLNISSPFLPTAVKITFPAFLILLGIWIFAAVQFFRKKKA